MDELEEVADGYEVIGRSYRQHFSAKWKAIMAANGAARGCSGFAQTATHRDVNVHEPALTQVQRGDVRLHL